MCESVCRTSLTDMSTYSCPNECDNLCKLLNQSKKDDEKDQLNFYGLTDDEVQFCASNKVTCLESYKLSWTAEKLCEQIYSQNRVNDESDACRHYVWAMYMAKDSKVGPSNAESILNAHENNPLEPADERAMDLANNRKALLDFAQQKDKNLSDEKILNLFKENLKKKKLVILRPRFSGTGGLP